MNKFTTAIFWKDGAVEPSDDEREQFLELESMRKRPCSRQCRGSFRNFR
jgi:hypothetical protein